MNFLHDTTQLPGIFNVSLMLCCKYLSLLLTARCEQHVSAASGFTCELQPKILNKMLNNVTSRHNLEPSLYKTPIAS